MEMQTTSLQWTVTAISDTLQSVFQTKREKYNFEKNFTVVVEMQRHIQSPTMKCHRTTDTQQQCNVMCFGWFALSFIHALEAKLYLSKNSQIYFHNSAVSVTNDTNRLFLDSFFSMQILNCKQISVWRKELQSKVKGSQGQKWAGLAAGRVASYLQIETH